jgi:hypothetical protein
VNLPKCEHKLVFMLLELSDLHSSNLTSVNEALDSAREQAATFNDEIAYTTPRVWESVTVRYESAQSPQREADSIYGVDMVSKESTARTLRGREHAGTWYEAATIGDGTRERYELRSIHAILTSMFRRVPASTRQKFLLATWMALSTLYVPSTCVSLI